MRSPRQRFFITGSVVLRLDAIAGSLSADDGPAASAQLNNPHGVAVDSTGDLYSEVSGVTITR